MELDLATVVSAADIRFLEFDIESSGDLKASESEIRYSIALPNEISNAYNGSSLNIEFSQSNEAGSDIASLSIELEVPESDMIAMQLQALPQMKPFIEQQISSVGLELDTLEIALITNSNGFAKASLVLKN